MTYLEVGLTQQVKSHNVAMTSPLADFVVTLGSNGRVLKQESFVKANRDDSQLVVDLDEDDVLVSNNDKLDQPEAQNKQSDGKLVMEEEVSVGHVGWQARKSRSCSRFMFLTFLQ